MDPIHFDLPSGNGVLIRVDNDGEDRRRAHLHFDRHPDEADRDEARRLARQAGPEQANFTFEMSW